jgi:CelD/BcsL family acetyltransferase involved in cellulose biosynthesis
LLLIKLIEAAPELGITNIDLGKGMYEWKQRFMNTSREVASEAAITRLRGYPSYEFPANPRLYPATSPVQG